MALTTLSGRSFGKIPNLIGMLVSILPAVDPYLVLFIYHCPSFKMVDSSKRGGFDSYLPMILFLSLLQCGTFVAISFDWFVKHFEIMVNEMNPIFRIAKRPSEDNEMESQAITFWVKFVYRALIVFNGSISLLVAILLFSHHCCRRRTARALVLTEIATTGASAIVAGASIAGLEIIVRMMGMSDLRRAIVPFLQAENLLLISLVFNVLLFFLSLREWKQTKADCYEFEL
ncbi:hypothetical protein PRIPAC_81269 [Pristionchus pacificus]|uniref:Uncharacterized protein n=1 Tax=Pristionchus pacificus TaxID=54126 RepID=A0A2A6CLQ1_PRIPA|nr:hypothetical protein PRIPAC_81269 [Pristionchus pacificus]|eukprot:PDM79134.1 hypothetical protein PRIPAC_31713 [Pristionchus pacificus]